MSLTYFIGYQFKDPSFHSWINPKIKIVREAIAVIRAEIGLRLIDNGRGINRTISISKTKNRTTRRKNRREKGIRALFFGSNPHS